MCSFDSVKGPSVTRTPSPSARTTVADADGSRPPPNTHAPADCISALSVATRS